MFASERFQSTVASRVMEMAELFRWHFPSRNTNRQTDLKRLEMMPHFEEDRQRRLKGKIVRLSIPPQWKMILAEFWSQEHEPYRQLLNEFHERPAEDQLATMEDWALQKESSEAQLVMSAGVMDKWDMSTLAQVRGRRIRSDTSRSQQFLR